MKKVDGDLMLEDLHTGLAARLADRIGEGEAEKFAGELVASLAYDFGGQQVYFPLKSKYIVKLIKEAFTGDNVPELVRRFRLSRSAIYKILKEPNEEKRGEK